MNLLYCCGNEESKTVVYKGVSAYGLLSSAYSIEPSASTTEPHVIPATPGDIEGENNIYQWYFPAAVDTSEHSRKVT